MYQANGTYYSEEHSVSFGELVTRTSGGIAYDDFSDYGNTWTDWHLIPSSKPVIAHPEVEAKFIKIPGSDGMLNLTNYLTGRAHYGLRKGSLSFYVDNGHEAPEAIRQKIVDCIHGKKHKMRLMDDPGYYYDGRYTVGPLQSGTDYSSIKIDYVLGPYKYTINTFGSTPQLWDPFNFETDYDYSVLLSLIEVNNQTKTYTIYAYDYPFAPSVKCTSGSITATFGGVTVSVSSGQTKQLGTASNGSNTLTVSGTGNATITWRGGKL